MKLSLYLDTRHKTELSPLKFAIRRRGAAVYIPTNILLRADQWDARASKVIKHPSRTAFNSFLMRRQLDIEEALLSLQNKSLPEIRAALMAKFYEPEKPAAALFIPFFENVITEGRSSSTQRMMRSTLNVLKEWQPSIGTVTFEDINKQWLDSFVTWCVSTRGSRPNTIATHLRLIRIVINRALDDELTTNYPFRRYRVKTEQTAKRSLEPDELRHLWAQHPSKPRIAYALDIWRLVFLLMGINIVDLSNLRPSDYRGGRICYRRAKTGKFYDIKVEPEAAALIEQYRSTSGKWLLNLFDKYKSKQVVIARVNDYIRRIPGFEKITTYWARHSWATMAAELDIPKETIAAGLGHGGATVTDIYIKFDRAKVDAANRRVIDFVTSGAADPDLQL